ncbi:MFS transporter [Desulfotalea psychrophila]|uniref:Conserved hypothetical membrane protein n=1 Tax=Desulfotalea psychrophila (strain LSv54 / DSM 12343) TaxID=177439 RepID=Q6AJD3_DESPS|nr:MFS transporter [Desulfotalea psychrophila]CAG37547.1 conserved hypothetical membrane protein [Desulfotalea psychrophila LSv54]
MRTSSWTLPIIVLSQFAGGSLWFSGNAIVSDLVQEWGISPHATSYITSSVQLGFILGTLFFAYFTIADRYPPKKIFFTCSLLGALFNSLIVILPNSLLSLIILRFATGFFLAGIYPVGMKIAAGIYKEGLGRALGFLVGALAIGTAFPHLLKTTDFHVAWQLVLLATSTLSIIGGLAMLLFVPNEVGAPQGIPFARGAFSTLIKAKAMRAAALGYFGHMWELYTLWAFIPLFLSAFNTLHPQADINIPLWTFIVIASGFIGGSVGGLLSQKRGSGPVACYQLTVSGTCCLLSPLFFALPLPAFLFIMWIWGICAAGDSPQYSTLIAQNAPKNLVGSALTLVNSIGFFLTIVSIQFVDWMSQFMITEHLFLLLLPGPLIGLYCMRRFLPIMHRKQRAQ